MTLKLNLGCGRVQFPLDPNADSPYPEHLHHMPAEVFEPGWVNIDKYAIPGVDEAVDLFRFPWIRSSNGSPWNDDSVDLIWCGHIVEHVPHLVAVADNVPPRMHAEYWRMVNNLDGFFVFFAEAYRLLRPGGRMHVRVPYALSIAALSDPTHTRYITPGTFSYLQNDGRDRAPFDYRLPMNFEIQVPYNMRTTGALTKNAAHYTPEGLAHLMASQFGVVDELQVDLVAIKEGSEP